MLGNLVPRSHLLPILDMPGHLFPVSSWFSETAGQPSLPLPRVCTEAGVSLCSSPLSLQWAP